MRAVGRIVVLLLLLAGCSSGGSSGGSGGGSMSKPSDVASKVGCTGYHDESTEELYVQRYGTCTLEGTETRVYTFSDTTNRDNWLKVARGFGGTYAVKGRAIVTSDSAAAVDTAAGKLGVSAS